MKLKKYFHSPIILLIASFITQSAAALQINYSNPAVEFQQGYVVEQIYDYFEGDSEPGVRSFDISFTGITNGLTTTLVSADLTLGTTARLDENAILRLPDPSLLKNLPVENGSMTFDEDGSLSAWNFYFAISDVRAQIRDPDGSWGIAPVDHKWIISSTYGENTCNCDLFTSTMISFTMRPYGTYIPATSISLDYGGKTLPDNWALEATEVSEPSMFILLMLGLGGVLWGRMRHQPHS